MYGITESLERGDIVQVIGSDKNWLMTCQSYERFWTYRRDRNGDGQASESMPKSRLLLSTSDSGIAPQVEFGIKIDDLDLPSRFRQLLPLIDSLFIGQRAEGIMYMTRETAEYFEAATWNAGGRVARSIIDEMARIRELSFEDDAEGLYDDVEIVIDAD